MRDQTSPTTLPFGQALYSDAGFATLGRVLERITGQFYNEALRSILVEPLGLNSSTTIEPANRDLNAMILPGSLRESSWGLDSQISAPSGGVYSNNADLRRLGMSILHSELLTPTETREWMKPRAGLSSLTGLVGAPWEISRLVLPVTSNSTRTRISDLYTKPGGQSGYGTVFALSPDHGIGFSVLLAGPDSPGDRWPLRAAVGEAFVVAAEWAAAENAADNLSGTFVDENLRGTNLTLSVDSDHPGLGLHSLFYNGIDYRSLILEPSGSLLGADVSVRLYPSGPERMTAMNSKTVAFRAVAQILPISPRAAVEGGKGLFDDSCVSWTTTGFFKSAAGYGSDEFFFEIVDGRLERVKIPVLDITMNRA